MMEDGYFSEESMFLVEPFNRISELVIEKKTAREFLKTFFDTLYTNFSDNKEYRSISDVDRVMKLVNETLVKQYPDREFLKEEQKEEYTQLFIDTFKNFLDEKDEEIDQMFGKGQFEPFLSHWIMNLDTSLEIIDESFNLFIIKKRKILRSSSRAIERLFDHLFDLIKALFLVLFRIAEQIYMISNGIDFDLEKEIDYLLNDIVYLENIQRQCNASLK